MRALPTKRPSVLGIPVGRQHTDWMRVGKVGAMAIGAVSTAAGGIGARRAGGRLKDKVAEEAEKGKKTIEKVGEAADRASSFGKSVTGPVSTVTSALGSLTGSGGAGESGGGGEQNLTKLRLIIKEGIDVGVPLKTAYNQWTQFADLPTIMKGPQAIDQDEDDQTRWVAKIGPSRRRWTGRIVEQNPDERIAWESTDGTENRGVVTFHRLDRNLTRVHVEMEYFPSGFVEKVGNVFLAARRRVRKDLRLFKHFLELNGEETGEWRGEIPAEGEKQPGGETAGGGDDRPARRDEGKDKGKEKNERAAGRERRQAASAS